MHAGLKKHLQEQHGPYGDSYGVGFLCGLQCNPETLVPSLWMDKVLWSDGQGAFDDANQARVIISFLAKEWETTEKSLRQGKSVVKELFFNGITKEYDLQSAYTWVAGFFDAAYMDGYDFIGKSEADQSAVAPFEVILSAGVQRGFAGVDNKAYGALQQVNLQQLLRDDLIFELLSKADSMLHRAYRHFRGIEPIDILWQED